MRFQTSPAAPGPFPLCLVQLVDASWHVKVSDFGLSRAVDASKAASTVLVTNPR